MNAVIDRAQFSADALGEVCEVGKQLERELAAMTASRDDWHKVADARSAALITLTKAGGNEMPAIQAVDKALAHWERMQAWVKLQPDEDAVSDSGWYDHYGYMKFAIGETWEGKYCACCKFTRSLSDILNCSLCPIAIAGEERCDYNNSSWRLVDMSETWGEWLENSHAMVSLLKRVKAKLENDAAHLRAVKGETT